MGTLWAVGFWTVLAGVAGLAICEFAILAAGGVAGIAGLRAARSDAFNAALITLWRLSMICLAVVACGIASCAAGCVALIAK